MEFFKKLFGKKKQEQKPQVQKAAPESQDLIRVHDEYGREVMITRQAWLDSVLLGNLRENYNNPDGLYNLLISALNDGFEEHVLEASERLYEIDTQKERGACIYAIVLMKNKKLDEAQVLLEKSISTLGESGVLLTNLAKVQSLKGHEEKAFQILTKSLKLDPNQDNGVDWYAAIEADKHGENVFLEAMKTVSNFPGAWRPYLWLARESLKNGKISEALDSYKMVFERNSSPDSQVLQQISGDLGLAGYLQEAIDTIKPYYKANVHGFEVGNNLIKAYIDIGQPQEAKDFINELFSFNRPDWREGLMYWMNELEKIPDKQVPSESVSNKMGMLAIEAPVWFGKLEKSTELFEEKYASIKLLTTAASCSLKNAPDAITSQRANTEGVFSRGLVQTLCDRINLFSDAQATMMLPVVEGAGFVFMGQRYEDEWAEKLAGMQESNFILLPHLYAQEKTWKFEVRLFEGTGKKLLKTFTKSFEVGSSSSAICELLETIEAHIGIDASNPSKKGLSFHNDLYEFYVDINESSLALSLATQFENGGSNLHGERNILDKLLNYSLSYPDSDVFKVCFLSSLAKNKNYGSEIFKEYQKKLEKLISDKPPASELVDFFEQNTKLIFAE